MKRTLVAALGLLAVVSSCDDGPGLTALPSEPQPFTVSGKVTYCQSDCLDGELPIYDVVLTLQSADTTMVTKTNGAGVYTFCSVPPGEYSVSAAREPHVGDQGAIGLFDAWYVNLHVTVAPESLPASARLNPCQVRAADIDGDGEVTESDRDSIENFVVRTPTGRVGEWQFSDPVFGINSDSTVDFTGVLLGDVDMSWHCASPPHPPDPVTLTAFSVDDWKVTLTWTQSTAPNFQSYELLRDGEFLVEIRDPSLDEWNDTTVEPENEYTYQVFVVIERGVQSGSNTVTVTTPAAGVVDTE